MNDDLKAYIDGELPPDAAERLREALSQDPALARDAEDFRRLAAGLRALPEPEPVGRAATLAALTARKTPLLRNWSFAFVACAGVLAVAIWVSGRPNRGHWIPAGLDPRVDGGTTVPPPRPVESAEPVEVQIPAVRRDAFIRFIHERGGMVRPDGDVLLAFYPIGSQGELISRFSLPDGTPWPAEGLRVRFEK